MRRRIVGLVMTLFESTISVLGGAHEMRREVLVNFLFDSWVWGRMMDGG